MKGIIINLFEDFLENKYGENVLEEILSEHVGKAEVPDVVVGPGTYPDEYFMAVISGAATHLGMEASQILREFGRYSLPRLVERYPQFFDQYRHPKEFLKTVHFVHNMEVKKLYKDAEIPKFVVRDPGGNHLVLKYVSARKLCFFLEGLIDGLSDHYQVAIDHHQTACQLRGDSECELALQFSQ